MADKIFVIDDDYRMPALKDMVSNLALALKGDIYWGGSLTSLNEMIQRVGSPKFLVLDNNLPDGQGINWIATALKEGRLSPETIIAAMSSSNTTLVFEHYEGLNRSGVGAFLKPHSAELSLWMAMRNRLIKDGQAPIVSQKEIYDINNVDISFYSSFGKRVREVFYQTEFMKDLLNLGLQWSYKDGEIVVPENKTLGIFQQMLAEGMEPRDILAMNSDRLLEILRETRGEIERRHPERE